MTPNRLGSTFHNRLKILLLFFAMRKVLAVSLVLLAVVAAQAQKPAHPEMLVSTEWLAGHLHDNNLILIQIGPERSEYAAGHISTARFLDNHDVFLKHENGLPVERLILQFRSLGVNVDSRIIIYSSKYPTLSTRLYWMLDYLGIAEKASLLDGGIDKWRIEKRGLSQDVVKAVRSGDIVAHPNLYVLAELSDVISLAGNSMLIDSRPQERYRDGHIPGAIPLYWQQTTAKDSTSTFLGPDGIVEAYENTGLKKGMKVITYCDAGFQATHSYFTLKYLGYNVRMYDGSYNEWNGQKHMPVVSGEMPR